MAERKTSTTLSNRGGKQMQPDGSQPESRLQPGAMNRTGPVAVPPIVFSPSKKGEDRRSVRSKRQDGNMTIGTASGEALRNSELRYRRLFESAQDGILILDARTGSISDVNPYLVDMLGYTREEFVEKKLWEVGAFKDIKASKDSFLALQKDKFIRYENLPLKTKAGH